MCHVILDAGGVPVMCRMAERCRDNTLKSCLLGCLQRLLAVCPTDARLRADGVVKLVQLAKQDPDDVFGASPKAKSPTKRASDWLVKNCSFSGHA